MTELILLGVAVGAGVGVRRATLLGLALHFPLGVLTAALVNALKSARRSDMGPALFCGSVAAELRSGSTLRQAISAAARAIEMPELAESALDTDIEALSSSVAAHFPGVGPELELTVTRVARTGAPAADLFDELSALAIAQSELRREIAVATAPAKATAAVLLGAPLIYLGWRFASGDLSGLWEDPTQRWATLSGLTLLLTGMLVAGLVMRWAR
jgi:Flp pilus assembly protein TadB